MTANLVGFVVGVDGGKELWRVMLGDWEGESVAGRPSFGRVKARSGLVQIADSRMRRLRLTGRLFLLTASAILFVGVQVMFEYRCACGLYSRKQREARVVLTLHVFCSEEERRKGISRKC